ncbi:MAG: hypothetical protein MZV63_36430 [Marinilabiliales bacterium]|nr:hypothetical protein [Marinilabiliales bacterium]
MFLLQESVFCIFSFQNNRNIAVGIIKIAKIEAFGWTNLNTGRLHAVFYPVIAEGAFINIPVRMRIPCIIRA